MISKAPPYSIDISYPQFSKRYNFFFRFFSESWLCSKEVSASRFCEILIITKMSLVPVRLMIEPSCNGAPSSMHKQPRNICASLWFHSQDCSGMVTYDLPLDWPPFLRLERLRRSGRSSSFPVPARCGWCDCFPRTPDDGTGGISGSEAAGRGAV